MPAFHHARSALGVLLAAAALSLGAAPSSDAVPKLRTVGEAKVVSVDGPARLTVTTKHGRLRMTLFGVDTPQVGECGATESVRALKRLVRGRKARLRYRLIDLAPGRFERDREGRYVGWLGSDVSSLEFAGLRQALADTGWARGGESVGAGVLNPTHGGWTLAGGLFVASAPRTPVGLWARCGGRAHLPLDAPVPATAPVPWNVTSEGVTESIGPLTLPATLSPGSTLTMRDVSAVVAVEFTAEGNGNCTGHAPGLQLRLFAYADARQPCSEADVYAIASSGPGAVATTRGLAAGARAAQARSFFPRVDADGDAAQDGGLSLAGSGGAFTAWRTSALVSERGGITGFVTTTAAEID